MSRARELELAIIHEAGFGPDIHHWVSCHVITNPSTHIARPVFRVWRSGLTHSTLRATIDLAEARGRAGAVADCDRLAAEASERAGRHADGN